MRNVPHLRPFSRQDLRRLDSRVSAFYMSQEAIDYSLSNSKGNVHTFMVGDDPAAIVGASCLWEGVWQVWAMVSDRMRGMGLYFTKGCEVILSESAKVFKVRRYNTYVAGTTPELHRWIKLLGFEYEFVMAKACPDGTDLYGYVRWMKGK